MINVVEGGRTGHKAFTLIELLVVIAILGILAAIAFGLTHGVNERARVSRAQTELTIIAQYLEQFRSHYGDYPRVLHTDAMSADTGDRREGEMAAVKLFDALNGMRPIVANQARFADADRQRPFIERERFRAELSPSRNPPTVTDPELEPHVLIDPWDNLYFYYYDPDNTNWRGTRYVLYSRGPSGEHRPPAADGVLDRGHPDNADNVFPDAN
jgi:prepilin-type N-terminal cleavage/methylation domain-containing protein